MAWLKYWTDSDSTRRDLLIPASFDWSFYDVDKNSGRNGYGLMLRERLGSKTKIMISWNAPKPQDREAFRRMVKQLKSLPEFVWVEYPDPDGDYVAMRCYRGDITCSMKWFPDGSEPIWSDLKANFIEQ